MYNAIDTSKLGTVNVDALAVNCEVLLHKEVRRAPFLLNVIESQFHSNIFTYGNFSAIKGKAKSKKTFLSTLLMGACLSNTTYAGKFTSGLRGRSVYYIDTEQSEWNTWNVLRRVCLLNGMSDQPTSLRGFCLRPYDTITRAQIIEKLIYDNDNIGLVVIDGIRDLVRDINSQEEATDIVNRLMRWTHERQIHICTVLHENKSDFNLRGHLGTEVANKCETVISVSRNETNKRISIVKADYMRDIEFEDFSFEIQEGGLPRLMSPEDAMKEIDF